MTIKNIASLSKIIDKMGLDISEISKGLQDKDTTQEAFGLFLFGKIAPKLHKVEDDIIEFIADFKKINKEEAAEIDIVKFLKENLGDIKRFFK